MSLVIEATETDDDVDFFASLEVGYHDGYGYQYVLSVEGTPTHYSLYLDTGNKAWSDGVIHTLEHYAMARLKHCITPEEGDE